MIVDSGIILVNKETNMTSRDVVNIVSKYLNTRKVGHLGTLDPLATGLMVLTVNDGTKIGSLLVSDDKEYIAEATIGIKTDTLDITGNVIDKKDVSLTKEQIIKALEHFKGNYEQEVPKYSAVKINGKKLYEYARSNQEINLPKREVIIKEINLLNFDNNKFTFKVLVSKGTYIRSLINDIGDYLDVPMTMSNLQRTKSGYFNLDNAYTLDDIKNGNYHLINLKDSLKEYNQVNVDDDLSKRILNGQILEDIYGNKPVVFIYKDNVIGIYQEYQDNKLKPLHIFN